MKYFFSIVLIILTFYSVAHAEITRTLMLGSQGADVRELQVFLNSDLDTRIATSGAGSPGLESTYFGARTFEAVKRLQIKYAYEALTPAGLSMATGIVGRYTRSVIYRLTHTYSTSIPSITPSSDAIRPSITAVSPNIITTIPQVITITGIGFTPYGNTVIVSSEREAGIGSFTSSDSKTLQVSLTYSGAQKVRNQLLQYQNSSSYTDIAKAFVQNIKNTVKINGVSMVPVTLTVKNSNGESSPVTLYIDIGAMLY